MPVISRTKTELATHRFYNNVEVMYRIIYPYVFFREAKKYSEALNKEISYNDAKTLCEEFDEHINPKDQKRVKELVADLSLKRYDKFKEYINEIPEPSYSNMMAFYNYVYYNFKSVNFDEKGFALYSLVISEFLDYAEGKIDISQFKYNIAFMYGTDAKSFDTSFIRRDLIDLAVIYHKICSKRKKRALNKED